MTTNFATKRCKMCDYNFAWTSGAPSKWKKKQFCTQTCANRHRAAHAASKSYLSNKRCEQCSGPVIALRATKRFCDKCTHIRRRTAEQEEARKEYRRVERTTEEYKQKYRAWFLKKKYGLTVNQFNEMLMAQGGACAVCKTTHPGWDKDWHVDHDHENSTVRGILCINCNLLIGLAKNCPDILIAASVYLINSPSQRVSHIEEGRS